MGIQKGLRIMEWPLRATCHECLWLSKKPDSDK
jgi:hypothetical protein